MMWIGEVSFLWIVVVSIYLVRVHPNRKKGRRHKRVDSTPVRGPRSTIRLSPSHATDNLRRVILYEKQYQLRRKNKDSLQLTPPHCCSSLLPTISCSCCCFSELQYIVGGRNDEDCYHCFRYKRGYREWVCSCIHTRSGHWHKAPLFRARKERRRRFGSGPFRDVRNVCNVCMLANVSSTLCVCVFFFCKRESSYFTLLMCFVILSHRFEAADKEEKFEDAVKKVKGKKDEEKAK